MAYANWETFLNLKALVEQTDEPIEYPFAACFPGKGPEMEGLEQADLTAYSKLQHQLIKAVKQIHLSEISQWNTDVLMKTKSSKQALAQTHDGKRGGGIYCLNNPEATIFVVGDLHGDDAALDGVLKTVGFFAQIRSKQNFKLVFLGDYVDRGKAQLRTLIKIMALKVLFPQQILLLRGNHDGGKLDSEGAITLAYRMEAHLSAIDYFPLYLQYLSRLNPTFDNQLCGAYLNLFDGFAYMSLMQQKDVVWMGVHGGLPRPQSFGNDCYGHIETLWQLTDPKVEDDQGRSILHNIMWSDPHRGGGVPVTTTGRFAFTEAQFQVFCHAFSINHLIRGHQKVKCGYRALFEGKCHTLFSTGDGYPDKPSSAVTAYSEVSPKVMKIDPNGEFELLGL